MKNLTEAALSRQRFLLLSGGAIGTGLAGCSGGGVINVAPSGSAQKPVNGTSPSPTPTAAPNAASSSASITITRSQTTGVLPPMLAGLSYEKSKISANTFNAGNTGLIACFTRLGASILRIGGNSVDQTTWTPNGPGGTNGQVAPSDISALAAFAQATGWRIIYGINLATNTPSSAAAEAAYAASAFGSSLFNFEIGNECDQYAMKGLRPSAYDVSDFITEWSSYASAIRQAVPNAPLSGPASAANTGTWTVPFASSESSQINLLTQHYYCGNGQSASSTMSELLAPSSYLLSMLTTLQSAAGSLGISNGYRLAEANSYYNGGAPGVSDAFGSALWAIDFLMLNAQYGSAGVNFHGGGDGPGYTPIADKNGAPVDLRPVYYAMLFVAQIAQGRMYAVNVNAEVSMTAYAVAGNDGATYLVIINKDPSNAAFATIALGAAASGANSLVLSGAGLSATTGTLLSGATVAANGVWLPNIEPGISASGSTLALDVAAASAVLLRII